MATSTGGKSEPDDYMMDFYPMDRKSGKNDYNSSTLRYMKMGQVYNQIRQLKFESRIKKWLKEYIHDNFFDETVVLAIAPGHIAYDNSSFMYDLVGEFISENHDLPVCIEDGRSLLVRYKTIKKQATAGANRSESTHRESIDINIDEEDNNYYYHDYDYDDDYYYYDYYYNDEEEEDNISRLNEGKVVIILDDVWTSGCTLRVCEEKVWTTGPEDVHLLAIGKTVPRK